MKDKKAIKKDILDKFRELDPEEDQILPDNWLMEEYYPTLDAFEQKIFKQAVKQLVTQGLVKETKNPGISLELTEKGVNLIH